MYGLHFSDTIAGRVFSQSVTELGLALPIYTATGICAAGICCLPLWNPPSSNVVVELIQYDLPYSSGTSEYGSISLVGVPLTAVGTGNPVTAALYTDPVNGYLGAGSRSKTFSYNGAGTWTATAAGTVAPTSATPGVVRNCASMNLEAATGTAHGVQTSKITFDGTVAIYPGFCVWLVSMRTSSGLLAGTVVWKEISLI